DVYKRQAKDAAGNDAVLTLPVPGAANSLGANKAIVIDGIAPVITSVSSTKADGSYGLGESIAITVTFDEAVTVTGTPQLELETGAVDRKVDYSSGTGTNTLTFNYTVQMGDESADLDYKATNALTLNGGTIKDAAGNDATLTLAAPGAANSLGNNKALVVEAFPTVTLSVSNTTIAEAAGTSTITATLSAVSSQDVTVTLAYSGTATSGIDYNNTASTSITVPAGNLSANAAVGITASQDVNPETNETVIIDITGVTKGTENGTQQQTITITDDDTPSVSFTSTTSSGLESVSSANITVDLNIASALTVTVDYTVTGTASSGTDYTLANGTLTFNPADVQETITIAGIVDDAILESNETVIITLSNPSNANLGTNTAHTYTITDNDAAAVTIADVSGSENGGAITLTATLDNAVQGGFTVEVSTADGTATTADSDYTSITSQTLTFAGTAGETQTFTITPTADTKLEGNETVTISQGNLAATSLSVNITDQATVTINNDDNASVTIADVSGSENGGAITLTATLDNAVQGGFTVDVNTADGTALAASDYTAVTSQTLTFAGTAGETQTFTVTPTDDAVEESTETLTVSMNNLAATALGVTITDNATITLTDDDDNTAPSGFTISISDALIAASETATTKFTFAGAEVGTTYNYTVSSNNGGTNVTGTGTIATATDEVTINNLSGLNDGTLTLSVTLTDGSSNTSTAQTATSQLDKTAPAAPVVTGVSADSGSSSSDGITSDTTPDVKGTAEANASIEVFVGGNSVGTTTADGSGDWTLAYSGVNPLADGTISVTAKATDAAGNTSAASTAVNVTIDATAPAAPVITSITPDSGTSTTDKITNDQTNLTITGTGEANSQLEITVNGITYSGLPVDGSGNWSIAVGAILGTDGTYPVTATVTDAAGNQSAASAAFSIIYDTTAPAAPTVDLDAASDLGQSNTDNITHYNATDGLMLSGTAEANAAIALSLTYNGITFSGLTAAADGSGNWTFDAGAIVSGVLADGTVNNLVINAQATDAAGNQGVAGTLTVVLDQQMTATLSPADNAIDILPSVNLTMAFGEDVFKGTGNITIKKKSDDSIIETIPVSAVTINSGTVTIDPVNLILPPATEFYINIDAGALTDIAGNSYTISNNTDWSFTIIASSVVTSVAVPANNTYKIGDELDFTANFTLPITITGTPSIPVTIGASTKIANLKAAVNNSSTAIFSYTIAEGDLDTDGIAIGAAISLNGGTIKDQFGTDAQLALNNVAATTSINVDGVRPVPTLTASTATLVNGSFTVEFTFSEAVTGFTLADITVANGTASNLATITAGTKWSAEITPTADGTVSASLAAGVANDNAGNASAAGTAVSKTYDGTAPTALSLTRKTANPILTASAGFRVIFSEDVTGVDLADFEVILTGTATGTLNAVTQVDAKTYDVTVTGISGQGSIGLNLKDDDSIIDAANNPLSGALTGEVYVTNMLPTDIALAPSAIDENNALSAEVGTLSTTDTDATDTHTYSLITGTGDTDNGSFMVAGNKLFAGAAFNHEVKDSYSIRLQTEDNNGGRFEKAFTITINDVNEAPTDMSLSNNIIDEADDAGVLVGTMASVDQDAAETFTYTLVAGTGDDNNLLFTFTGDELRTATPINFETNTTLSIRVKVTDSGGLSYEEVFSITVNNVELEEIRDFTKDAPDARIKNFFSPNGDGINDLWVIDDILDNPINEVKVFSQNGTLIFSERNYKNTWDGTYKGEAIPPGTYYYEINVYNGEQIVKGFLTIIRTKN
ncbi:Ig-like domain-containing protein, partial [Roseivirga seohaensis]|uniref:Ig-like domain-containing protein n=1 Tax=Roseivirga seohaensis TaxID=1914963 RepID=UPI000B16B85E